MSQTQEAIPSRSKFWMKLALFLVCTVVVLIGLNVGYQALNTLRLLDSIEAERDQWQRPSEVIEALNIKDGDSVVDLGCGSGYFSLKLSSPVGTSGKVIAEDIRSLSLAFLWVRAVRKGKHNISVRLGNIDDPHLRPNSANAVLISNSYHEFTAPKGIVDHVRESLVPGGRLVVIDRSPDYAHEGSSAFQEHEISSVRVEADLRQAKFEIDSRDDHFIDNDPEHKTWWMIVAHAAKRP